jgi:phosphatidylinositol alpha-1,6-mannosyltransferase
MIRAIANLRSQFPDVLYAVCGNGDERENLNELVAELRLADHVQFMGEIDDSMLLAAYQQCDLFAFPNREVDRDIEGFGMVLVEAQACGRPVLAGDSGGTRETMSVDSTGVIADCTSVDAITLAVGNLLSDQQQRQAMGQRARTHVRERFDWATLSSQAMRLLT